ncbi:MAG TPA: Flp pilus assembly protein CpaB [Candidatus Limnocylindria bacterium]
MRASKAWIFLLAGVLLAGLTGVALYQVASTPNLPSTSAAKPAINVVIARVQLPPRTVLTADMLTVKSYPADLVPPGSFTTVLDAAGKTTSVQIAASQPIVRDVLSAAGAPEVTSLVIESGKVLVAFPTNDPLTGAGLVSVGDTVDLLATVMKGTGENARLTQTTVQNLKVVEVIAPTKEQPNRARALVFVVDHQVALVLKYLRDAQTTVDVAVRSHDENAEATTATVDLDYLMQEYEIKP